MSISWLVGIVTFFVAVIAIMRLSVTRETSLRGEHGLA
jgi:hypothetical protein